MSSNDHHNLEGVEKQNFLPNVWQENSFFV